MKILLKGKRSCTLNNSRIKWIPQLLQEEQIIEMFSGLKENGGAIKMIYILTRDSHWKSIEMIREHAK